jgi:hypothetical protein
MTDRFDGTEPDPASAGSELHIHFCNPSLAGTVVTVTLSNGDGLVKTTQITLDADGCGVTTWPVPAQGWDLILLTHTSSEDHTVAVKHGGEAEAP